VDVAPDPVPGDERTAEPAAGEAVLVPEAAPAPQPAPDGDGAQIAQPEVVELALAAVELSPEGRHPAVGTVSLLEVGGSAQVDIVMARADAVLVQEAIAGTVAPRPRTHDLLLAAVRALGGAVVGVTLVERRTGGVYVASLRVRRSDGFTVELDARPSDALNVALRSSGAVLQANRSLLDVPFN
jgi:bifunctional DNase/RNase